MKIKGDLVDAQGQIKMFEFEIESGEKVSIQRLKLSIESQVVGAQLLSWWVDK